MSFRLNVIFFIALLALHAAVYPFANVKALTWFGNVAQAFALLFAGIHFSRAARKAERKEVHSLNFLALGFWICVTAHALLAYSELLLEKPATGTVTDAIWFCGYVLIARSLFLMASKDLPGKSFALIHSGLLVFAAGIVSIVLWRALIDPARDLLTRFIQAVFPFLDFWIAAMAFVLAKRTGRKGWLAAAFGSLIIGAADLVFPFFYKTISPVYRFLDIPLFIGYSLWWLTGAHFAERKQSQFTTESRSTQRSL